MCPVLFHYVPFRSWEPVSFGALSERPWNLNGAYPGLKWGKSGTPARGPFELRSGLGQDP